MIASVTRKLEHYKENDEAEFGEVCLNYFVLKNSSSSASLNEDDEGKNVSTWSNFFTEDSDAMTLSKTKTQSKKKNYENIDVFEQFVIKITISPVALDIVTISSEFESKILKVIEWCNDNKNHIPNLTNLNILPFNYKLIFNGNGENAGNYDWKGFIKKILK